MRRTAVTLPFESMSNVWHLILRNFAAVFTGRDCKTTNMLGHLLVLWIAWASQTLGFLTTEPLDSKLVFDPAFYVNTHADLHRSLKTTDEARKHWLTIGIKEGRQGCGSFHSVQYLKRYPDLSKAFGKNYQQAIQHYLSEGYAKEKRLGYVEGGDEGRWTISSHHHDLFLSSSRRTGGAVDSLVWDHKEFINSWDHGREMQMAMNTRPWGECFNPTEAGSRDDAILGSTTSIILHVRAHKNTMETVNYPAFWLRPGDTETRQGHGPCGHDKPALNKNAVYKHQFSKTVTIGCAGLDNCMKFVSNFTLGGHWPDGYTSINLESPACYMTSDFRVLLNYDFTTKKAHTFNTNRRPTILATSDGRHAMGLYAPSGQDSDLFQYYNAQSFGTNFASGTNKLDVVFRKNPFPDGTTKHMVYTSYACVGTKDMVTSCLEQVHHAYPSV